MEGLIFIPDISGFTRFVKNIEMDAGVSITKDLLSEIIENNPLDLELSEVEGDAVLFYKIGKPIPLNTVFKGLSTICEAFKRKYHILKAQFDVDIELSLKFILHYGEMSVYDIKGFRKLYGQTIIESHRLLKNGSNDANYILITEDYVKALRLTAADSVPDIGSGCYSSQNFTDLREVGYYFFTSFPTPDFPKDVQRFLRA